MTLRPTSDGWAALAFGVALVATAWTASNNLLILVAAGWWAALGVGVAIGWWHLRGLEVRRDLPGEVFADTPVSGSYVVLNRRRVGRVARVRVVEGGTVGEWEASPIGDIPPYSSRSGRAVWRFLRRGRVALSGVQLRSTYPLQLFEHRRDFELPCNVIVAPTPEEGAWRRAQSVGMGDVDVGGTHPQTLGDIGALRAYQVGDAPRSIHWPTTARVGSPMVVVRTGRTRHTRVVLADARGPAWERELCRAAGVVCEATAAGWAVDLCAPDGVVLAVAGARGRREGLELLALAEPRP